MHVCVYVSISTISIMLHSKDSWFYHAHWVEGVSLKVMAAAMSTDHSLSSFSNPFVMHEATYITCQHQDYIPWAGFISPRYCCCCCYRRYYHHFYYTVYRQQHSACEPLAHSSARFSRSAVRSPAAWRKTRTQNTNYVYIHTSIRSIYKSLLGIINVVYFALALWLETGCCDKNMNQTEKLIYLFSTYIFFGLLSSSSALS